MGRAPRKAKRRWRPWRRSRTSCRRNPPGARLRPGSYHLGAGQMTQRKVKTTKQRLLKPAVKRRKRRGGFLYQHFPDVTEVVDATEGVQVQVGADDNVKGVK